VEIPYVLAASAAALGLWVHGERAINRAVPPCLTSEGTGDGTPGPVVADAMPDNDARDFLSHDMKPVQQMLGVGVQIELKLAHGVPAIGENGDLLVQLMPLRLEHFEEPTFRFLVKGLHERK
jgi:hypothetical protein